MISESDSQKGCTKHPLIVYDGLCQMCSTWVQFVCRHDKKGVFRFAPMQSLQDSVLIQDAKRHSVSDALILLADDKCYIASDAAIEVFMRLGGYWKCFFLLKLFPAGIRNWFYRIVARNRYRWFGKRDSCYIVNTSLPEE